MHQEFDIINQIPAEYMHLVCLGVVKKLFKLAFQADNRMRIIDHQRLKELNQHLLETQVPSEFSRRTRPVDFSNYKAEEWRNMILIYFPFIVNCLATSPDEALLWSILAFIVRANILNFDRYSQVWVEVDMEKLVQIFYRKFESMYGKASCSYNIHVFSHLTKLRALGPLTTTSAFAFEDLYGILQRCYQSGTSSTGKQAFQNYFLKKLTFHQCEKTISFSCKQTKKRQDGIVCTEDGKWYNIVKVFSPDMFVAREIKTGKFTQPIGNNFMALDFSLVGVWKYLSISNFETNINKDDIIAKGTQVGDLLIEVPFNVLRE